MLQNSRTKLVYITLNLGTNCFQARVSQWGPCRLIFEVSHADTPH